jgi:hypothetical protein
MDNILCHIVGLNNAGKELLIDSISDDNILIKDLNEITNNLRSNSELNEHMVGGGRTNKTYNKIWKNMVRTKIVNISRKHKYKNIILLGLCTHHKNNRVKINIDTKYKYIINTNSKINAKQIVENNIDIYRKHIINGKFPLKYLDHKFLTKQKEKTVKLYNKLGYKNKSLNNIIKWIKLKINNDNINNNNNNKQLEQKEYYIGKSINVSNKKRSRHRRWIQDSEAIKLVGGLDKKNSSTHNEQNVDEKITAFDSKWLALVSSIDNVSKYIRKGYLEYKDNRIPYIEEKIENGFDILHEPAILYTIENINLNKIGYKYIGYGVDYKSNITENISDVYNELKKMGIKKIPFNQKKLL